MSKIYLSLKEQIADEFQISIEGISPDENLIGNYIDSFGFLRLISILEKANVSKHKIINLLNEKEISLNSIDSIKSS